ncbi:hydroxyethylthiazole kinase [Sporosarcina sp. NCCP-2222]|uniref:hydroxyethylthiazole kinase n=1 Tax=Sporosarcina sp. NCCP-2222 TaxID=2935073 RepID=UPI00208281E4|nr:hydroxyethylthiazole kinase [Sporosarcina sp. NCCP-2222]GKV57648.1 hydroxyethylthiazole kinase [Sporosarcina sp. NCCP-2222]
MDYIQKLRAENPLIHCMTNFVVANFQANGLLAIGASPIMADAFEEAADIAALSSCTLLNIGTLDASKLKAMIEAGKSANKHGKPVIVDPVGAGATPFRKRAVGTLLQHLDVSLIRGNAGEIAALANVEWDAKGVDAGVGSADTASVALELAQRHHCLVAVTGEVDVVTDGKTVMRISGGHPHMTRITGAGCLLSAVCAAFLAIEPAEAKHAVASALAFYKKAGERAASKAEGPGDFALHLLNALYSLNGSSVDSEQIQLEGAAK